VEFFSVPPIRAALLLLALVLGAAVYDVRYRRIPNWLALGGAVCGVALNTFFPSPDFGFWFALKGLALGFGFYLILYALRAMGAGDVKLMGAVGAIVGWHDWIGVFLLTALIGGLAAIVLALVRKRLGKTFWNLGFILSELKSGRPAYLGKEELDVRSPKALGLPHGAIIAVAAVVFLGMAALQYFQN
jgi:prepilin peptidase CpaA